MESKIALFALDTTMETLQKLPTIDDGVHWDMMAAVELLRAAVLEGDFVPGIEYLIMLRGWSALCMHDITGDGWVLEECRQQMYENLSSLREIKGRQVERLSGRPRSYLELLLAIVDVLAAAESELYTAKLCNERLN